MLKSVHEDYSGVVFEAAVLQPQPAMHRHQDWVGEQRIRRRSLFISTSRSEKSPGKAYPKRSRQSPAGNSGAAKGTKGFEPPFITEGPSETF